MNLFQTFLGQKYGYRPFPPKIAAPEFEKLLSAVDNEEDLQLLKRWFWRDDNAVPAQYLLQPITSLLPHYRNYENNDFRKKASAEWWTAFERMQIVLRKAADKALEKDDRHRYHMSGNLRLQVYLTYPIYTFTLSYQATSHNPTTSITLILIMLETRAHVLAVPRL